MSERKKTLMFDAVALVLLGLAVWTAWAYSPHEAAQIEDVGQEFFPEFKDPLEAARLEIVKYSDGQVYRFEVAQKDGRWVIPSHYDYPADAEEQLAKAATALIGLKKLDKVSDDRRSHAEFGVIEPDPEKIDELAAHKDEEVGMRVIMADKDGNRLAALIIGKKAAEEHKNIHYVRVPGQDRVYKAEIDPAQFSTSFGDWIEKDLLKLDAWDIRRVVLNLYSFDETQGRIKEQDRLVLTYDENASGNPWKLEGLKEDQELDTQKLNDMRYALDDLKIIDVRRKPEGLGRALRQVEGGAIDPATVIDLARKGFYLTRSGELISNQGEVIVTTKEGVEYVLRFGEVAEQTIDQATKKKDDDEESSITANRYLFITARFNPEMIPKPDLKPLPELPPEEGKQDGDKDQAGPKPDQAQKEEKPKDKANSGDKQNANDKADDKKKDGKKDGDKSDAKPQKKTREDIIAERKRIQKENERKQKEYDEKVKKAKEKVKELNDRFADWYYVISDAEYKKIRLTRADIVKPKKKEQQDNKQGNASGSGALDQAGKLLQQGTTKPQSEKKAPAAEKKQSGSAEKAAPKASGPVVAPEKKTTKENAAGQNASAGQKPPAAKAKP